MDDPRVQAPAGFVPAVAMMMAVAGDMAKPVGADNPLPTRRLTAPASVAALTGEALASGTFGPFAPELGRPVTITLAGNWSGTVSLLRSIDDGATKLPLTFIDGSPKATWTANVNAPAHEEYVAAARLYLDFQRTGGTLLYRMEQ